MRKLATLCVLVGLSTACDGFGSKSPGLLFQEVPAEPNYVDHVAAMMDAYCNECHADPPRLGAPGSFRLDVYEDTDVPGVVTMAQDSLDTMVGAAGRPMPPRASPQMSDAEIEAFEVWIGDGMPYDAESQ